MPTVFIDNKPYEVSTGKNLLEVCLTLGFDLPYFCWHPALGSVGACRQCAVKIFKDEGDTKGKLVMSCMEPVANNQRVSITDVEATEFRSQVIEWLMTNHPHDCAVCDEGGSCHLQDMTVMTGHNYRRYRYKKRTYSNQDLGPFINHEMNRCIQCYRCVRFYKDYAGGRDLDAFASKNQVYFGRAEDGTLESEFSGNLAEVCPTGVFTDKTLKEHYTRKWDLTMAPSVCQHCSLGCNIVAGERYGTLRMIGNRYHSEINGYFICDRGRFGYEFVNATDRIRKPVVHGKEADKEAVIKEVAAILKNARAIGIGSPRASIQSNFALKALVGKDNFYHGVSEGEHSLAELAIRIITEGPAPVAPIQEVEQSDAVFILGEDLTNTAPILALGVRQATRQQPGADAQRVHIPEWHDAAVREIVQEKKGPLFVAGLHSSKLDSLAQFVYHAAPDDLARFGFAVAHALNSSVPAVDLPPELKKEAKKVADALSSAKRPVVISGASTMTEAVMKAAASVAWALHEKNQMARIVLTMPESNSFGLAMMGGHQLNAAFNAVLHGHADTVVVMENDLYRHGMPAVVDQLISKCKNVIVFDHSMHPTATRATVLIPAGTFAESDGIMVNNEGRAQRFFQVYESTEVVQESWRWLLNIGVATGNARLSQWKNFSDITRAISSDEPLLKGGEQTAPPPEYRVAGQRIPREPHRYSGRTAMNANIAVSEPKPPEDPDSPLSYTMEGFRGLAPSSSIPFFWSPGWNSVQSVNKYQTEVGGALRGGDPGVKLMKPSGSAPKYFTVAPEKFIPLEDHLWIVPLHHIFGSEEMSVRAVSVATRIPKPYVLISAGDAERLQLGEDQVLEFAVDGQPYRLPVKISEKMQHGVAGIPYGLPGMPYVELPEWGVLSGKTTGEKKK